MVAGGGFVSSFIVLHVHGSELLLQQVGGQKHHLRVALKRLRRRQVPDTVKQAGRQTSVGAAAAATAALAPDAT